MKVPSGVLVSKHYFLFYISINPYNLSIYTTGIYSYLSIFYFTRVYIFFNKKGPYRFKYFVYLNCLPTIPFLPAYFQNIFLPSGTFFTGPGVGDVSRISRFYSFCCKSPDLLIWVSHGEVQSVKTLCFIKILVNLSMSIWYKFLSVRLSFNLSICLYFHINL